jgi:hypothetical protein
MIAVPPQGSLDESTSSCMQSMGSRHAGFDNGLDPCVDASCMRKHKNQFDPSIAPPELRAEIEAITRRYDPDKVHGQLADMESLRLRFPHSVGIVEAVDVALAGPRQFNCYMYALNIHDSSRIAGLLATTVRPLGNEFMRWLVDSRRLKATADGLQHNDIILYSDEYSPLHAGRWNGSAVVSKWGLAHLWKHPIFEVPTRYGHIARSYRGVNASQAEKWFFDYMGTPLSPARRRS